MHIVTGIGLILLTATSASALEKKIDTTRAVKVKNELPINFVIVTAE